MFEDEIVNQTRSYESAAKDIEQEKKMVAALKRLSISNMMSYDPDLPIEDMEYQYQYQQHNDDLSNKSPPTSPQMRRSSSLSRKSSLKGRPSPSEDSLHQDQDEMGENISDDPQQEQVLDTETLLWVPADLHPEVDPEQFKIHVKTKVGEIMERKLSRKNSLSRHSSLSSSFLADDKEEPSQSDLETPEKNIKNDNLEVEQQSYQEKRFSNPSLRDLSFELENLSRLAGMDSTDAVTIARTLSSSSLGYTDVEKQAFDELSSPPHTSPNNSTRRRETDTSQNKAFVDPESPTSHKTVNRLPQEHAYSHSGRHEQQSRQHQDYQRAKSQFSPNDFSLKRSRRLDYRKLSNPSASGSSLQNNKAGKLAELRNNLNSPSPSPVTHQYHLTKQPEHKSKGKQRKARDSQLLFSYRNPNVPPESQSSKDSPYPNSASSSSPLEQQFNTHKFSQHNVTAKRISHIKNHKDQYGLLQKQGYSRTSSRSSSGGSGNHSVQSFEKEKTRPIQSPPNQPFPSHTINKQKFPPSSQSKYRSDNRKHHHRSHGQQNDRLKQQIPQQSKNYVFQLQIPKTRSENRKFDSNNETDLVNKKSVPQIKIINDSSNNRTEDKSTQLNQNLDMLRSEINEFKESLTKIDSPAFSGSRSASDSDLPESSDNNESDFSFEASYQNISYEDSLGIEKDVLNELDKEKSSNIDDAGGDLENKKANPFVSPEKPTATQEPVSELVEERGNDKGDSNSEDLLQDFEIDFDRNANKDVIELSEIDQDPLIEEIAGTPDEEFISKSSEPVSRVSSTGEVQKKKSFGLLPNHSSSSFNSETETKKTLKKKKSWPWLKERSASFSSSDGNKLPSLPEAKSPSRSFSTPETPTKKRQEQQQISKEIPRTQDIKPSASIGKENMISKFFKKKRSNSSTSVSSSSDITNMDSKPVQDSGVTIDYESDSEAKKNIQGKLKGGIFKKMNRNKQNEKEKERLQSLKSTSVTSLVSLIEKGNSTEDLHELEVSRELKKGHIIQDFERDVQSFSHNVSEVGKQDEVEPLSKLREEDNEETLMDNEKGKGKEKETEKTKPKIKTKLLESRKERALRKSEQSKTEVPKQVTEVMQDEADIEDQAKQTIKPEDEKEVSRSALDVQEKLKKSIKRTSKANQPIEFTDSAFGFPLPPPSQSTLVMLDYRFPVHVERAIYRLSHLKLANPKRSLREQVLLSNFMYAYLNLVDHTLHLEQLNNNTENTTEVLDDTKELNFAAEDVIVTEDELDDTQHDSDQVSIDLDIVDLSNTPATTAEVQ
ncbi:uncharacterized protein AC631_05422 [Debaryomyces fabryi]|uniref:Protein Zds1 C-terminal domain-containing protein n=1 Tax=Debaryomyces fabryi TaxID=58627 RepID=A0A0V1PRF5_9ASCO|nr:uncharacterized protein AC631_05422 [Debaryomyces fabryi]KRZ98821.1 hypothetical protein AC631_05422 [Debaryomyces fabryi]CUM45490.1 unnamed protein product [Debaryomyces fabryi]